MGLEDYKDIVATSAMVTTMAQMLAGTLICRDICKKGSTKGFDPMPFVGGIGMCLLMLRYAWIVGDPTMINVNVFGFVTNVAYMSVFYIFAVDKMQTLGLLGKAVAFVAVFLGYAHLEDPNEIEFRFGLITTILLMLLVASPLVHLGEIVKTRSCEILPFPLIMMGTLVSAQWLLYGLIINNPFIINAVGFTLSAAQLSLFAIFPSQCAVPDEPSSEKKQK